MLRHYVGKIAKLIFPNILYSNKSFSQDGEDLILNSYFKNKKTYKGFFVDVGAHHPYRFSNTALFYKKGWRGINIEPTPNLIPAFKKYRSRDINLNIAISNSNSTMTFYEVDDPALNSFDEALSMERAKNTRYKIIAKREIEVFPLSEILDKYLPQGQKIDFFTIDVEGHDMNVLESNNWEKYSPQYILIEGEGDFEHLDQNEIYLFLKQKNYKLIARAKRTFVFALQQ